MLVALGVMLIGGASIPATFFLAVGRPRGADPLIAWLCAGAVLGIALCVLGAWRGARDADRRRRIAAIAGVVSTIVGVPGLVSVAMITVMASLPGVALATPGAAWAAGFALMGVSLVSLTIALRFRAAPAESLEEYVEWHQYLSVAGFFAHERPAHTGTLLASLGVYGLVAWQLTGLGPLQIGATGAVLVLFLHVSIWKHEIAHALVARALGMDVLLISVGAGPKLLDLRVGTTKVLWHALPTRGGVMPLVWRTPKWRLHLTLLSAAGPAAELVALLILLALWNTPKSPIVNASWVACTLLQALSFVANSVPSRVGAQHTDGFSMWNAHRLPVSAREFQVAATHLQRVCLEVEGLDPAETLKRLRVPDRSDDYGAKLVVATTLEKLEKLREASDLWGELERGAPVPPLAFFALAQHARVSARLGELDAVRADAERLLDSRAPRTAVALAIERLAYTALVERSTALFDTADGWLRRVTNEPTGWSARSAIKVTHAAIGLELERIEEARPELRRWRRRATSANHRALAALYLAVAVRREGRRASRRLVAEARAIQDAPKLLEWFDSGGH